MSLDDFATDWAIRHGTGLCPSDHDTIPAPSPEPPDQSHALRRALDSSARLSDEDTLRFMRAIHTVRQ